MKQTYKELQWRAEALGKRLNYEKSFRANLHGRELIGGTAGKVDRPKLTEEQKVKLKEAMERSIARKGLKRIS